MDDELANAEIQSPEQNPPFSEERRNSFGDKNFIDSGKNNDADDKCREQNHKYALI